MERRQKEEHGWRSDWRYVKNVAGGLDHNVHKSKQLIDK
jgi:hypothetical protein